jgi:hypothetical protein
MGEEKGSDIPLELTITMGNIGKSPTSFFGVDAVVIDTPNDIAWTERARELCKNLKGAKNDLSALPTSQWPISSNSVPSYAVEGNFPKASDFESMRNPYLCGCALYAFNDARHQTPFGAHLKISAGKITGDKIYSAGAN